MLLFAIFAAILLLGALLPFDLIPPLRQGRAFNGIAFIRMPDRDEFYPGYWICVYAQEIAEWWLAWAVALIFAAPFAWALSTFTPFGLAAPLLTVVAWNWRNTVRGERLLEYVGWGIEREMGLRLGIERYASERDHANGLWAGYRRLFKDAGVTPAGALAGLRRWRWLARALLVLLKFRIGGKL